MAEVLGALTFLDTPDVNGDLVLTSVTGITNATSVAGTANQISVTGSFPAFTVGLTSNPIVPGTGSLTLPTGTTAQRPGSPIAGMERYNTTIGSTEYYNGTAWIPAGTVLQTVIGSLSSTSSNSQIPYDNTTPTSTEGLEIWTQSFTPLMATSIILITTNSFYTVASAADIFVSGSVFNGTTCIYAQLLGWTTNIGTGQSFTVIASQIAGSTAARSYSFRAGPNSNVTVYYSQGTGGQNYGSVTNSGRYIIQEIAP